MPIKKNIRILVVTSTFPRWKNDTDPSFVYELCKHLSSRGYIVDVIAPHTKNANKYENMSGINVYRYIYFFSQWENLTYSGGILSNLKKARANYLLIPFFLFTQLLFVYRRLKLEQYDLIHAHWLIPQGFICAVIKTMLGKMSVPVLCTAHGSDLVSLQHPIILKLKSWALSKITKVTVVSKSLVPYMDSVSYNKSEIEICSMGVDLASTFKKIPGLTKEKKQLIYVGRLIESKGVKYLIQAVNILIKDFPDIKLNIIGDGQQRNELELLTKNYGLENTIAFKGALPKSSLPEYYSIAGIAITPSVVQEGLGLVIVEAMGCGCIPVVSNSESSREIVVPDKNGILFESGNPEDMANKIKDLLTDNEKYTEISANVRQSVLDKYDWNIVSTKYAQIINSILSQNNPD